MNYSKKAFTLVETIIVVTIISVLAMTVHSYFMDSLEDARYNTVKINEKNIQEAIGMYFKENLTYPTSLEELQNKYLTRGIREMIVDASDGKAALQVQVSNVAEQNVYHVKDSDRIWITYEFGGNAHGGKQICAVRAIFDGSSSPPTPPTTYVLTLTGTNISSVPAPGPISANTAVSVTVSPPGGQVVDTFTVNGTDQKASLVGNTYSFNITSDTNVAVTYAPASVNVTLTLSGTDITSLPAAGSIPTGTTVTITLTPDIWQVIDTFTVAGVDQKASLVSNEYSFVIAADTTAAVTYSSPYTYVTYPAGSPYNTGDYVYYNGDLFQAKYYTTSVPGSDSSWNEITSEWRAINSYNPGDIVTYAGAQFEARFANSNNQPGVIGSAWQELTDQWRDYNIYNTNDECYYLGIHYRANWYNTNIQPPNACWTVIP